MDLIFDPSLGLYLPLYELDGASFMSKDKHGHLCTVTGALWTPQGRDLDGGDDYLGFGADIAAFKPATALTVGIWYKNDISEASTRIVSMAGVDSKQGWMLRAATDTAVFHIHDGTAYRSVTSTSLTIGAWHFVVATYNKTDLRIYAEGALACTPTAETDDIQYITPASLHIGVREGLDVVEFFDGKIGEVWIYNRALTPREIQRNYLATKWRYR